MRRLLYGLLIVPSLLRGADSTFVWNVDVRVRGEADGRDFQFSTPMVSYTLLRTRLGADVRPAQGVRAFVQAEDSRWFGGAQATTGLHQGYVMLGGVFTDSLSVKVGRMELAYGNERVIGKDDWGNVGRVFDGILVRYAEAEHAVDLFSANVVATVVPPQSVTPVTVVQEPDQGFLLSGLWYQFRGIAGTRLAGYVVHEWDRNDDALSRGTVGVYADGSSGDILYNGEAAYQGGQKEGVGIAAFMVTGSVGLAIRDVGGSIHAGYQYLSGTASGETTHRTFEAQFHSPHDLYGAMDYFADPVHGTNGRGLQDIAVRISAQPAEAFSLSAALHHFLLALPWSGLSVLGEEADLHLRYSSWNVAAIEAGLSAFFPGDVMKAWYNGSDVALWGFLGARVAF
jgi:hypothetical protein